MLIRLNRSRLAAGTACALLLLLAPPLGAQELPVPVPREQSLPDALLRSPAGPTVTQRQDPELTSPERGLPMATERLGVPLEAAIDPDKYLCGHGDLFELVFWGRQNFSVRFTIDMEGQAFIARMGFVKLQGQSLSEARKRVSTMLARYYDNLQFRLSLIRPRNFMVHAVGHVRKQGRQVSNPLERVSELLERSGISGSLRSIEVRHLDGSVTRADLLRYFLFGALEHNPRLREGDVVRVPPEGLMVEVSGAVNRPGRFELIATRDLDELFALVDGVRASSAALELPIRILRHGREKPDTTTILLPLAPGGTPRNLALQDGDRIHVPARTELRRTVLVVGAVATEGRAAQVSPGGVTNESLSDDAPSTRRVEFAEGDTVRVVLERAGGVINGAADLRAAYVERLRPNAPSERLPIDLEALVVRRDLRADRPVQIGDVIVIPVRRRAVAVEGAVVRPGSYQYNPHLSAEQYLNIAGGLNRFAQDRDTVRIITPDGNTRALSAGSALQPGDTILAPERTFTRAEWVGILISVASLTITTVLTAYTLTR